MSQCAPRAWHGARFFCALLPVWGLSAASAADLGSAPGPGPVTSLLEMRQEGVVIQKWDLSCGAAALATVLAYQHDDPVPEKEIAKALISRDKYLEDLDILRAQRGFSLLDLKRYVDTRGYNGIGYKDLELEDLIRLAPIMVPIVNHGYDHFVVFRGVHGDRVLLADPAWGNRTMRVERFSQVWLNHPRLGRVGFIVAREDGPAPPNRLAARSSDFVMLR